MQQDVSQQTTFRACRPGADPSLAAAQKPQWASCLQVTTPQKPPKKGCTSLLTFVAAPRRAAPLCYKRKYKSQKSRHQRRRSETTEGTSSTSSDERIKSKTRMRRERRVQKYTTTIRLEVTLFTVTTSLHAHVIGTHNCQPKCDLSSANMDR